MARVAERRLDDFNAQELANMAWALASAEQRDKPLLASVAERRPDGLNAQVLTNTAWAFATARLRSSEWGDFDSQELSNTAWAYATAEQSDARLFVALARATG